MDKVVIGGATLFLGDCVEAMREMQGKTFDLAIVDPPYGINAPKMSMGQNLNRNDGWKRGESTAVALKGRLNSGGGKLKNRILNTSSIGWDNEIPSDEYFDQLFFVSQNQIIWGGNYFNLRPSRCVLCWDKCQPWEMAWTSFDKPAALYSYSNTGGANKETKIHPTQKPIRLYQWLLSRYAKEGDTIIDTHMGSGSSVIACLEHGYEVTAFEINPEYFEAACTRIERSQHQLKLAF